MSELAIQASGVTKSFKKVHALNGVSLEVKRGSVFALLGPNGAGKTTLVRILTTLLRPDAGELRVGPFDAVREPHAVRTVIGLAGQAATVDENLTGRENLQLVGKLYHLDSRTAKSRSTDLLDSFQLTDAADRTTKTYSGGMRRRLDLAASLVGNPEILFLDEPTTGLDPRSRLDLWSTIEQLAKDGVTILLTTQYLEEADYLADMIAVIDKGRIIAQGTPEELKSTIGGDVIEIHVKERSNAAAAAAAIRDFASGEPVIDEESGKIVMPVEGGPSVLTDVVRSLDAARIAIEDLNFRRPSLDEVFLTLTGEPVSA